MNMADGATALELVADRRAQLLRDIGMYLKNDAAAQVARRYVPTKRADESVLLAATSTRTDLSTGKASDSLLRYSGPEEEAVRGSIL
jgi:hypothetical protein